MQPSVWVAVADSQRVSAFVGVRAARRSSQLLHRYSHGHLSLSTSSLSPSAQSPILFINIHFHTSYSTLFIHYHVCFLFYLFRISFYLVVTKSFILLYAFILWRVIWWKCLNLFLTSAQRRYLLSWFRSLNQLFSLVSFTIWPLNYAIFRSIMLNLH